MISQSLPMTNLLLHKQGSVEAHEASYLNQVFVSYVVNTEANRISLSSVRTTKANQGQGLEERAMQWLRDLADAQKLSIEV